MAPTDDKPLRDVKNEANPSQLGDPVSLKAEASNTQPTETDKPNKAPGHKSLKEIAREKNQTNPSQLGDPVSLKAETSQTEPTRDDRGALGTGSDRRSAVGTAKPKI